MKDKDNVKISGYLNPKPKSCIGHFYDILHYGNLPKWL